jgi:beta-phosphoglucomutase-like phosphatase (HAD superfamily)
MNRLPRFRRNPLKPRDCVAIEDSIHGIQSAKRAGTKCIGVTNSYSKEDLREADLVVGSLEGIEVKNLKF